MSTPHDPDQVPSLYAPRSGPTTPDAGQGFRRPLEMWVGAAFLTVAALPLIVVGAILALQLGQLGANLRQKITDAGTSVDVDTLVNAFRVAGAVLLVLGVAFAATAWVAVQPKSWARRVVTALAAVEIAALVFAIVVTAPDPVTIGVILLAAAGTVLLYLPRSEEFLLSRR